MALTVKIEAFLNRAPIFAPGSNGASGLVHGALSAPIFIGTLLKPGIIRAFGLSNNLQRGNRCIFRWPPLLPGS